MNIQKALIAEHSKAQTDKIVKYIGDDKTRFKELMELFFGEDTRVSQRAAWSMSICASKHPALIKPYLKKMILNMEKPVHDAIKRNTVRILQEIEIPDSLLGKTADICFQLLANKSEAVAIKAFSMTVLLNIVKKEPDLKNELKVLIEDQMEFTTAAFKSRGKKTLLALEKI